MPTTPRGSIGRAFGKAGLLRRATRSPEGATNGKRPRRCFAVSTAEFHSRIATPTESEGSNANAVSDMATGRVKMVPEAGLEPARDIFSLGPQPSASANSAIPARIDPKNYAAPPSFVKTFCAQIAPCAPPCRCSTSVPGRSSRLARCSLRSRLAVVHPLTAHVSGLIASAPVSAILTCGFHVTAVPC